MDTLTVFPDTHAQHILQIYAGLYGAAEMSDLDIRYSCAYHDSVRKFHRGSLWGVLTHKGKDIRICFDMFDGPEIASFDGLEKCDIYFKRSYRQSSLDLLEPHLRTRVRPFGLNLFVAPEQDSDVLTRIRCELSIRKALAIRISAAERQIHAELLLARYTRGRVPNFMKRFLLPRPSDYAAPPQTRLSGRVLYQARVWSKEEAPKAENLELLNYERAELVRSLRRTFGRRFVGGLVRSSHSEREYKDCLTDQPSSQKAYLSLVRATQIAIVSIGLHGSTPWKVAEYLAASRCIVTPRLNDRLPVPLEPNENACFFETVEECLGACDRLLTDTKRSKEMQRSNREYYRKNVLPGSLIGNCLNLAKSAL